MHQQVKWLAGVLVFFCLLAGCQAKEKPEQAAAVPEEGSYVLSEEAGNINRHLDYTDRELKKIYMAGGCFWGVEAFLDRVYGVAGTVSGYANGTGEDPSYEEVIEGDRNFVEAVEVTYDPERVSLEELIGNMFTVIDPTSKNKQGNDIGVQYRTGIYYTEESDAAIVAKAVEKEQQKYKKAIVTETEPLQNFYRAEEYHQDYLEKNPNGYCHINLHALDDMPVKPIPEDEEIVKGLSRGA